MTSLLELLVRLFPPGFRARFGAELIEQIRLEHERARARGIRSAVAFGIHTSLDLARSGLAERLNPTRVSERTPRSVTEMMRATPGSIRTDFAHALRALRRAPGFTALAVGTLGLALGANAGIFSVVDAVILRPLPYAEPDRLVYIGASAPGSEMPDEFGVSAEFYIQYQEAELLQDVAFYGAGTNTLRVGDRAERVRISFCATSLFRTLGVTPILGRLPVPEDDSEAVLISHALWTSWFGSDPEVVGRSIFVAGEMRTVVGVMGPDFWFQVDDIVAWVPYELTVEGLRGLGWFGLPLVGRLAPGATHGQVVAELDGLADRLPERFGGSASYARLIERHRPVVRPIEEEIVGGAAGVFLLLLGSVAIVLLIACANVANLFMVRAERRRRDHALRRAMGATRARLIRAGLAESSVVALLAGALAILLAWTGVPVLLRAGPEFARMDEVRLSGGTVLFTLAASAFCAFVCGIVPAVRASAARMTGLREGGRGSTPRSHRARDGLVVAQTALALTLLIGSALLVRSFMALWNVDPGYETADRVTFQFAPDRADLVDGPSYARFHMDFMRRVAALPGVESVGVVQRLPLDEGVEDAHFVSEERAARDDGGVPLGYTFSGGDYFATMGIDVLRGRAFRPSDHLSDPGNVVVSRSAAELLWPGEDPVGRRVRRRDGDDWYTVVGVVEDVMQDSFREAPRPLLYHPLAGPEPTSWFVGSPAYVVETGRGEAIMPEIRERVRQVAPRAPIYRVFTLERLAVRSMTELVYIMFMLGVASMLALILGTVGLYGVLSYAVAERTHEIGVRMALGAEASRVQRMVVAQGARVVALGILVGVGIAVLGTRILGSLLFGVEAADVGTFAGVSAAMLGVGFLASYLPARRASSVDPIGSLRGS